MNFENIPVMVLGDVMLDHYISGKAERMSPEAAVPVLLRENSWTVPGGAANVARCLSRLGCQTKLIGLIGRDNAGAVLGQEIQGESIGGSLVETSRPTTCKTRLMAQGKQLLRVDEETIQPPSLEEIVSMRKYLERHLPGCKALVLSDYAKGALLRGKDGESICETAIKMASELRIPVLVDPKGTDWGRYAGAQCVTPNLSEFTKICAISQGSSFNEARLDNEARVRQKLAEEICRKFHFDRLLLTRGPRGMNLFQEEHKPVYIRAARQEVADVSGAGDTVIATLAACVASGMNWDRSAEIANQAAGIAVTKVGAAPVSITELSQALRRDGDNTKLYDWREIQEKITEWRRQGQKIVFTNGCFDLLHPGHISLLRQSAALGDRLVVGLNSDSSVKRLKGESRPLQNEQSRALLLGAMRDVDAVVIFEQDTPEELIRMISPDYLVKGSDYKLSEVVGADFVRERGGQVFLADIMEGCSTTDIVAKIKGKQVSRP